MDLPVSKVFFPSLFFPSISFLLLLFRRATILVAENAFLLLPVQLKTMSKLPNPPPDPASNNPYLRDITLTRITTFVIGKYGEEKEVSCVALQDLVESEFILKQMDTARISRLSYDKWAKALIEDLAYRTHEVIRLHNEWKIWIPGLRPLKISPNDHGFRAAITKWFVYYSASHDADIAFFIKRLSSEERNSRHVLSILGRY